VKLPDLNLLLYAIDAEAKSHEHARAWLEETLSGTE
jgi:predicted nucleic acid-binding protein